MADDSDAEDTGDGGEERPHAVGINHVALPVGDVEAGGLDVRDPWGNRLQIVEYGEIQFTKADHVLAGMGLDLEKSADALAELEAKGMAPE